MDDESTRGVASAAFSGLGWIWGRFTQGGARRLALPWAEMFLAFSPSLAWSNELEADTSPSLLSPLAPVSSGAFVHSDPTDFYRRQRRERSH